MREPKPKAAEVTARIQAALAAGPSGRAAVRPSRKAVAKRPSMQAATKRPAMKAATREVRKKPASWLRLRPDGCSKCRGTPGCTRSCYGTAGPPA